MRFFMHLLLFLCDKIGVFWEIFLLKSSHFTSIRILYLMFLMHLYLKITQQTYKIQQIWCIFGGMSELFSTFSTYFSKLLHHFFVVWTCNNHTCIFNEHLKKGRYQPCPLTYDDKRGKTQPKTRQTARHRVTFSLYAELSAALFSAPESESYILPLLLSDSLI